MFVDIETFLFDAFVNTQTVQLLNAEEQDESTGSSPKVDDQYAKALCTKEAPTATIEGICLCGQQTGHDGTQDTANAVY